MGCSGSSKHPDLMEKQDKPEAADFPMQLSLCLCRVTAACSRGCVLVHDAYQGDAGREDRGFQPCPG